MLEFNKMKIALIAPSATFDYSLLEEALDFAALNNKIEIWQSSEPKLGCPSFLNGSKIERMAEIIAAQKSDVDAIWCIKGGVGALELWHEHNKFLKNSAPFVGYSDNCIIHFLRFYFGSSIGIHGPVFLDLKDPSRANFSQIEFLLNKEAQKLVYPPLKALNKILFEEMQGEIIPMNLITLQSLIGCFDYKFLQGKILCLEEINEPHYRVFRALQHLKNASCLAGVKALVVGQFNQDRQEIIEDCFKPLAQELGIPLFDWPIFGHEKPNWPLLFGAKASIAKVDKDIYSLKYLEQWNHDAIGLAHE